MENFDRENMNQLLKIHQYFLLSKFCAIWYYGMFTMEKELESLHTNKVWDLVELATQRCGSYWQ